MDMNWWRGRSRSLEEINGIQINAYGFGKAEVLEDRTERLAPVTRPASSGLAFGDPLEGLLPPLQTFFQVLPIKDEQAAVDRGRSDR